MSQPFDDLKRKLRRRDKIRYFTIIGYIFVVLSYVTYLIMSGFNQFSEALYLFLVIGGAILIIAVIIYPYFKPILLPVVEDGEVIDLSEPYSGDEYYEKVVLTFLYFITLPFIILYGVSSILVLLSENYLTAIIFGLVILFFTLILLMFEKIEIIGSKQELTIKLGPFKEKIDVTKIISSRPITIKPIKTYLGFGKRVGTDGSIGYISGTTTGVRLEIEGKRSYVLSSKQPQILVNYLRSMKNNAVR